MIWLKAFGCTLGVGLIINSAIVVTNFAIEAAKSWPEPFQVFIIVAAIILSTLIWKKVLEK